MTRSDYTAPTFVDVAQSQWGSPPVGAVALDAAHVNAMANAIANSARWYAGTINVKDYGAKGDGTTDDSAAFAAAAAAAKAGLRTVPYSLWSDPVGSVVVDIPAGNYLITTAGAMLGNEAMTGKGVGLWWRGAGKSVSNIIFKPATAGALLTNDYWQQLKFTDLGFFAGTTGCTFMRSYTTHAAQDYTFRDCGFYLWKYGLDLQGTDNNCEFLFESCATSGIEAAGAFFYVGAASTSDQFLNYWFIGCKHWSTSAPFIDTAAGGSFHIFGLDLSNWGGALTAPGNAINLRGTSHAYGVCNFEAQGVRIEGMSAFAGLLYSEWNQGNVAIRNADLSSQLGNYTYGDVISLNFVNSNGAIYHFEDSTFPGGVRVKFATNDWDYLHQIRFTHCRWMQKHSPSDVVTYDTSAAGGNALDVPPVSFTSCAGTDEGVYDTVGAAVWDATIGYRGQPLQTLTQRTVSLRGTAGLPSNASAGDIPRVTLPVGALITGVEVMSPAGAVTSQALNWTFTLRTTDTTPVTVATAVVTGQPTAGFDVTSNLAVPFECTTAAKATLTLNPTNVDQWNTRGVFLIKGYW